MIRASQWAQRVRARTASVGVACVALVYSAIAMVQDPAAAAAPPSLRTPLVNSDVSILVPLKANADVDDVFRARGTGLCNAVPLNGTTSPLLTEAQFSAFAASAFGRGTDLRCNTAGAGGAGGDDAAVLARQPSEQLARLRGLPGRACNYAAWHIVGFRFEPCFERPGKTLSTRTDLTSCTAEARLVVQPWNTEGIPFPDDISMHLIYRVPNTEALVADLFAFAAVTREATQGKTWDSFDSQPNVLRPHPGLRLEMERCEGPVSKAYKALLAKHTNSALLRQVAFMTSSTAQVQWSFGAMNATNGTFSPIADRAGDRFDNFSGDIFNFGDTFPFNRGVSAASFLNTAKLFTSDLLMHEGALSPEAVTLAAQASADLNAIEHPSRIGQGGTNCISCHMTQQSRTELQNKGVTPSTVGAYPAVTLWPPFADANRSTFNFRNFGYGPGFSMGVSRRAANETDDVRRTLNTIFR